MSVLVTGATGFFGFHVLREVRNSGYEVHGVGRLQYDLSKFEECRRMFEDYKPNVVIHLAAETGGILKNKENPFSMWHNNMLLIPHVFRLCSELGVKKLIYIMPGCSYPKVCSYKESELWNGYPDEHPAPFSLVRKMGLVGCWAMKKQHGVDYSVLIPGNMYGEHDCFDLNNCHVIPALIRKIHESDGKVRLWGSGEAVRDFVYAGDVAQCIPFFIKNNYEGPVNISSGNGIKIKDLAVTIKKIVNEKIEIEWDTSMPEGPSHKVFDVSLMKSIGLTCDTLLIEGLKKTYSWFLENYCV